MNLFKRKSIGYDTITVAQYYRLLDILADLEDENLVQEAMAKELLGVELADLPINEATKVMKQLDFLRKPYEASKPHFTYKIGGKVFKPVLKAKDVTTALFVDFQGLLKLKDWKHLMNCLFIEKNTKYGDVDNSELLYEHCPLSWYLDLCDFWDAFFRKSQVAILNSSIRNLKRMLKKAIKEGREESETLWRSEIKRLEEFRDSVQNGDELW